MGFPIILFGHLKNDSFLIFSKTWCTGSRNTALTAWVLADLDCPAKSLFVYWSNLKSLISWWITLAFPFPCCWSPLILLYLSIWSMSWRTLVIGLLVRDFLKPCSAGRLTLKVLMATSSKSPSISLKIFQYISVYVFRVSHSHMDKDNKEPKGRGTQLHIIKREPNAQVSSLKKYMEFAFRPSNYLIATSPRLNRNILHIKALSLEWIAILWLKSLTCSTGSIQPL